MHLQQTKRESAESGGPQYYFHNLDKSVKTFLRSEGVVPVALVTPYGATKTHFQAVSKDQKLEKGKPVPGNVGHDRIQQGKGTESIGEAIRHWYGLPPGQFERIDIEIDTIEDAFYLRPVNCKYAGKKKTRPLAKVESPLTFTRDQMSPFWRKHLDEIKAKQSDVLEWAIREICRIVTVHRPESKQPHVLECDLLRASGPLNHLGIQVGPYVGKGYDCCFSRFEFRDFPPYEAPIEVKKNSAGFSYQQKKYGKDQLTRAIILCANHNLTVVPANFDVIELEAFYKYGRETLSMTL